MIWAKSTVQILMVNAHGKCAGVNLNTELNEVMLCELGLNEGWLLSL